MASENPPLTDEIPLKTYIFDYKGCSIATFDHWRTLHEFFFQPKAYVAWKLPTSLQVPNQHDGWRQRQRNIPRASLRPLKYRQSNWHDGSHPCLVYKVFPPHWVTQTRLQPAAWHESGGSCRQSEGRSPARWNHWLWPFPVQWLSGKPNIMNHIIIELYIYSLFDDFRRCSGA